MNNTTFEPDFFRPSESMNIKLIKAIASSIVTFFAIFGNFLVVTAVWLVPRMQTVTNHLIVNMAVADFLYILVVMPPFYVQIFEFHEWAMGSYGRGVYFCIVVNFGQYFLVIVSVLTLACIGIDRFFAIVVPLRKVFTKQVFRVIVPAIWLIAAVVAAPLIYAQKIKDDDGFLFCEEDWSPAFETRKASKIYSVLLFAVAYCLPFFVITIMYTIVCRKLWKRKVLNTRHKKQYRKAIESRKKVVKMLITVVIAFVVCWLPVQVTTFVWEVDPDGVSPLTYFICMFLMRAHACMSPFVYAVFSENYRRGFKVALTCCCPGKLRKKFSTSPSLFRSTTRMTISTRKSFQLRPMSRDESPDDVECNGNKRVVTFTKSNDQDLSMQSV